jgi:UPF0755 protein
MSETQKKSGILRVLSRCTALGVVVAVVMPVALGTLLFAPGPLSEQSPVVIPHGENSAAIGKTLRDAHAVYAGPLFRFAAKIVGGSLKAGEYAVPARASMVDIALMMHDGKSIVRLFTVPEGLMSSEIVGMLNDEPVLTGTIDTNPAEGSLLPETYRYSYGDTRASLIARMQKGMQEKLNEVWAGHDSDIPLQTPQQAVVMASVVEKETGKPEERPRIAGVFYNRLRLNMRLQSDPTVIYALTGGSKDLDRALTHEDQAFASPINTYASDGLPSQPICNPGLAALQAAVHPEHHNFLYFVADGSGGHAFAADLAAHNENINHWHAWEKAHP